MIVMGLDPGPEKSAIVVYGSGEIYSFEKLNNVQLLASLKSPNGYADVLCIEQVASFGMPVGAEVFETVFWSGRFAQAFPQKFARLTRIQVKMHLCHNTRAKDANIRQSLIDRFGGIAATKKGGVLYKMSGDCWSALAVAITYWDQQNAAST